jgi:hypothetical protein
MRDGDGLDTERSLRHVSIRLLLMSESLLLQPEPGLKPVERVAMVVLGLVATVTAIATDSPVGLLIVGIPMLAISGAIAADAGGFGQRVRATATWRSQPNLDLRLFRFFIGGGGFVIALAVAIGGFVLVLR